MASEMARNVQQCSLFPSGKVMFSVSFYFRARMKVLFSVSCDICLSVEAMSKKGKALPFFAKKSKAFNNVGIYLKYVYSHLKQIFFYYRVV